MDRADVEGDAVALYHHAGMHASDPPGIGRLVSKLLGAKIERTSCMPRGRLAELVRVHGKWRIYVRRNVAATRLRFDAAHELAHWWYRQVDYAGEDIEQRCDALGAAIIAPRPFYVDMRRDHPEMLDLAEALGSTQSMAVLREGEVCGTPIALVYPSRVIIRGDEWGWPSEAELRRVARTGHPALRRVQITDEGRRVALLAA